MTEKLSKFIHFLTLRGDQPTAIVSLIEGLKQGWAIRFSLGVTGSGKTFTMAHVIETTQRPALILAPNKTLAASFIRKWNHFSPKMPLSILCPTMITYQPKPMFRNRSLYWKRSTINEQIDRMRHSATRSLFERRDVIIVASVSCIYGIGSKEDYYAMTFEIKKGQTLDRQDFDFKIDWCNINAMI